RALGTLVLQLGEVNGNRRQVVVRGPWVGEIWRPDPGSLQFLLDHLDGEPTETCERRNGDHSGGVTAGGRQQPRSDGGACPRSGDCGGQDVPVLGVAGHLLHQVVEAVNAGKASCISLRRCSTAWEGMPSFPVKVRSTSSRIGRDQRGSKR